MPHDIDAAVQRARERLAHELYISNAPTDQLRVVAEAVLDGQPTSDDIQALIDMHVQAAVGRERIAHDTELRSLQQAHENDLIGVDEDLAAAKQEAFQKGKHRMRVKHAQLSEAADVLRQARKVVDSAVVWTGPADWKPQALERIDNAIKKFTP